MAVHPVTGVRGVDLGVRDLEASVRFYKQAWGLEEIARDGDTAYLRATGPEHHALVLRQRPRAALLGARFAAPDRATVDRLHAKAKALGISGVGLPEELPEIAGGGYGFRLETPDGVALSISSDVAQHADSIADPTRPSKFSHVVLRSSSCEKSEAFFRDVLGFTLSDRTDILHFLRCSRDRHSVALARLDGPGLHHMAFELPNLDALMRATGRVKMAGYEVEWGTGRQAGPGNNVFSVFVEPNGFAAELTTEMDQCGDDYPTRGPDYWRSMPIKPCAWGIAMKPSARARDAQSGRLIDA